MISIKLFGTILFSCSLAATLLLHPTTCSSEAQKPVTQKFQHAIDRSADAGRIVTLLALTPEDGLPNEIADRAKAIGVFPKVEKDTAMFSQILKGYGVISARTEKGWTLPSFYQFAGGGYGNPFANHETYAVILLFMTKDSLKWFERGGVALRNQQKAIEGPVGTVTEEQLRDLADVPVLAYAYYNGKLNGKAFGTSFWKSFALNPDNNINKPVYGIKGREVLAGASLDPANVLTGISAYRDALVKYYAR